MKKLALLLTTLVLQTPVWAQLQLSVDDRIRLLAVDGKPQAVGLFKPSHQTLKLEDGAHTLELRYEELFDRGADDHEVVRSSPARLQIPADLPAGQYRLTLQQGPESLGQAHQYRKAPLFVLKSGSQTVVQVQGENLPEVGLVDRINQTLSGAVNAESRERQPQDTRIGLFQQLWNAATPAERQAMLDWARQHP
jgi:uncharacterized protein YccT (UPF0319 family)